MYILADQKKGSKKIIIILVVVGLFIALVCSCVSWKWIAARRGNHLRSIFHKFCSNILHLSFSHVFPHELGKKKMIEHGIQEAYFPADAALQEMLSQINLDELPLF